MDNRIKELCTCPLSVSSLFFFGQDAEKEDERSLSFYQTHTKERLSVTYKEGGEFRVDALKEIDYLFRDHRTGEIHPIDPKLLDYLYDLLTKVKNHGEVHIISAYRSPETNRKLRKRGGGGVAKRSLHMQGKALDFRLPGTSTAQLKKAALQMKRGRVGYYPEPDFVQIDTGRVRRW